MVAVLTTEFSGPANTTVTNGEIVATFQVNTININSWTSEKNYALCIYEFVAPLCAVSQTLILQRKQQQLPLFTLTLNKPAAYQGETNFKEQIKILRPLNSFKLFSLQKLRPPPRVHIYMTAM